MGIFVHSPEFAWRVSNVDGVRPSATDNGTSVTPAQNSKGSWAQCLSATARMAYWVEVLINHGDTSAAAKDMIVDIGIDTAGGSSYVVLIPDLLGSCASPGIGVLYAFPVCIPSGSTVAARASVNNATVGTVRVQVRLLGSPRHPEMVRVGQKVEAVGIVAASSRGTTVTSGTTSEGAWTSLGTTSRPGFYVQHGMGVNDSTMSALVYGADIGAGASGTQRVLAEMLVNTSSAEQSHFVNGETWVDLPSGETLWGRLQCSGTADAGLSMAAYVVGN